MHCAVIFVSSGWFCFSNLPATAVTFCKNIVSYVSFVKEFPFPVIIHQQIRTCAPQEVLVNLLFGLLDNASSKCVELSLPCLYI